MKNLSMLALWVFLGVIWIGCGDDDTTEVTGDTGDVNDDGSESNTIEIFSWWTAPGEAEALQALIDVYTTANPSVSVVNVTAVLGDGNLARDTMRERIANNTPPDTFQLSPQEIEEWVDYQDNPEDPRVEPLDDLFQAEGWLTAYPAGVIDAVSYHGHVYAVPVGMHRQNALFYNTSLVDTPPTTLVELFALCESLQEDGVTPLAISASAGWTIEIVFRSLLAASAGSQYLEDFYAGNLDLTDTTTRATLEQAVDDFLTLMSYTNDNASELSWSDAAKLVFDGDAAMYIHGDWAKGYYQSLSWEPGLDFAVIAVPGTAGTFIYNIDAFALCVDGPNAENTLDFLRVVGSPAGQSAFNRIKGSTPVNGNVDVSTWDDVAQATFEDFTSATVLHNINVNQFSVEDEEGNEVGITDQIFALYNDHDQREAFISWIVDHYAEATSD